jgi:hypothetical protein
MLQLEIVAHIDFEYSISDKHLRPAESTTEELDIVAVRGTYETKRAKRLLVRDDSLFGKASVMQP